MRKKGLVGMLVMGMAGAGVVALSVKTSQDAIAEKDQKINKFKNYYNMLNKWLYLKQNGTSLDTYFKKNDYNSIAIYGMGEMGNRLYDEIENFIENKVNCPIISLEDVVYEV